ncbi:MAG TPA: sodium:proton antiporter [Anaerovoracaceae bacterium]|nr:sodium:proton antiporter [Anaerovoracaceae bacterium]
MNEQLLFGLVSIIVLGVAAQWLAWKLQISTVILFMLFGILAGPISGIIQPDLLFGDLLMPVVSLSVALILFEGGLTLNIRELRTIGRTVNLLISVGMLTTWVITSIAAYYVLGFEVRVALLLGALLVVTGPTVIIPLLRQMRLLGKAGSILKWEGILIDPIGSLLALLVFQALFSVGTNNSLPEIIMNFFRSILTGGAIGFLLGYGLSLLLQKRYIPEHLQNPVSLMLVFASFVMSNMLQTESGLLAVTIMGITLANQRKADVKNIIQFKETLGLLVLSSVFVLLTARLSIQDLAGIGFKEVAFLIVLVFVARPISVFITTLGGTLKWQERVLLSFIAPRGVVAVAVSSVFALRLSESHPDQAADIVPVIFFVVIGTVLFYSILAQPLARYLKLVQPSPQEILILGAHEWGRMMGHSLQTNGFQVTLIDTNRISVNKAREDGLTAHIGNILSSEIEDRIDFNSIGKLLAITSNDEVNSLATLKFSDYIGKDNVFQLPLRAKYEVPIDLRGRMLFHEKANYDCLQKKSDQGSKIIEHLLTDEVDCKGFISKYGESAIPLFYQESNKGLKIITRDNQPVLKEGTKLFFLAKDRTLFGKEN